MRSAVYEMVKKKAEVETPFRKNVSCMAEQIILAALIKVSEYDAMCPVCGTPGEAFWYNPDRSVQFACDNKHGPQGIPLTWVVKASGAKK